MIHIDPNVDQNSTGEVALMDQQTEPQPAPAPDAAPLPYLSVVIPVYNETKRLANSVPS